MIELGYLAALLGGVLTLLSPCGALLLPSFFAYAFGGVGTLFVRTSVFFLGLAVTLVPLGAGASFATSLFYGHRDTLIVVAGGAMVVLGVVQALGGGFASQRAQRLQGRLAGRSSHAAVFGLGAVYGFAGFCSGPILGAVLTVAATDGRPARGAALLAVYALGMAVPLFLLAWLWDRYDLGRRRWLRGRGFHVGPLRLHTTSLVSGALFVVVGVLFLRTRGTASAAGLLGPERTLEAEAAAQAWLQRTVAGVPDAVVLGVLGVLLLAVLVRRARRTPTPTGDPPPDRADSEPVSIREECTYN